MFKLYGFIIINATIWIKHSSKMRYEYIWATCSRNYIPLKIRGWFPQNLLKLTYFLFKNAGAYKMGGKWRIFTHRKDFAIFSTVLIRWSCNFTWSTTMHMIYSRILLTNLQKYWGEKLVMRRSEASFFGNNFLFISCKMTAPSDKNCRNESKIRTTSITP